MTDSQQHRTTKYGLDENGHYLSGSQHPDWKDLLEPDMENARFGLWTVLSRQIQRKGRHIYAQVRCECGKEDWKLLDNLRRGVSKSCMSCRSKARHKAAGNMLVETPAERSLQRRITAMMQRCTNPNDKAWPNYGGRGIEFRFQSTKECADCLTSLHPAEDWKGFEIDRIDNSGHYEPGNIRRATPMTNRLNRRRTQWVDYRGVKVAKHHLWHLIKTDYPDFDFGPSKVRTLVEQGMPADEIPHYQRVGHRRSTTLKTPDPAIVSLYRDV